MAHCVEWATFWLFTLGSVVLLVLWATMEESRTGAFVTTFFVCSIAALTYFAKCTGFGDFHINGAQVPLARYIDWALTTPLLMYELCHLAHASSSTTLMLVGCDILMISAGIFSACLDRMRQTRLMAFWFFASCVFYVLLLGIINFRIANGPVLDQPAEVQELFGHLQARPRPLGRTPGGTASTRLGCAPSALARTRIRSHLPAPPPRRRCSPPSRGPSTPWWCCSGARSAT